MFDASPAESSERADDLTPATATTSASGPTGLALAEGDLVWGPARGFPSWPGQIVEGPREKGPTAPTDAPSPGHVWVRWFSGNGGGGSVDPRGDRTITLVSRESLKSLSEGLEAHHRATKKFRK